jgi:uncharacterized protein with NRDE domain
MCTLVVIHGIYADAPLIVAANRDERLDRLSAAPAWRHGNGRGVFCPLDLEAGGTWIGVNDADVFAGITNRFGSPSDSRRLSRGDLVLQALNQASAAAAMERLRSVAADSYNGFHLLIADRSQAFCIWSDGVTLHHQSLAPGAHLLTERSFGAGTSEREGWLSERVASFALGDAPSMATLQETLSTHRDPTFEGACVHWDDRGYGTRSATLLRMGASESEFSFLYADTPPCEGAWVDYTSMWREGTLRAKGEDPISN